MEIKEAVEVSKSLLEWLDRGKGDNGEGLTDYIALRKLITFAEEALNKPSVGVEEIEKVLGTIESPIDESILEWKKTSNPAVVILKNKWSTKIAQALLNQFVITRRGER